jgi:hypothetical protein
MFIRSRSLGVRNSSMNRMAGISTSTPFFTTRLFSRWERGVRDGLSPAVVAPSKNSRGDPGLDLRTSSWATSRDSSHAGEDESQPDVHVKHSDARMGRSAVRVPVRGRRTRRAGCRSARAPLSPSGKAMWVRDVGVLGMTELGLDSRTK